MSKLSIILLSSAIIVGAGTISYWWMTNHSATPAHIQQEPTPTPTVAPSSMYAKFYDTVSLVPLSMCEAVHKATQAIEGKYDALTRVNDTQKKFIAAQYMPYMRNNLFDKFSGDELKAYASRDYKYLNDILKQNGFTIQLAAFSPDDGMGIVAIQNIIVKWPEVGDKVNIDAEGKTYEGVHLHMLEYVNFFTKSDYPSLVIVELLTKTDDKVYLVTKRDGQLFEQVPDEATVIAALMEYQGALRNGTYKETCHYNGVKFPMILYNKKPDISWILGLKFQGSISRLPFIINQALQEVIFKMNEKGAQAKVATAFGMCTMSLNDLEKETLVIDKPFLVWIERPGVPMPLFADYMAKEYWQNPGELPD